MKGERYQKLLEEAAKARGVPVDILNRVAGAESNYNPRAVSSKGAQGLFQIMPDTQRSIGVTDPFDPAQSALGGATYLQKLHDQFGDWKLATAAYNAGPGNVKKYGGVPPFKETQNYQRKIWGDDMGKNSPNSSAGKNAGSIAAAMLDNPSVTPSALQVTPKRSKLDTAMSIGSGMLGAVAALLGGKEHYDGFSPVSASGHGAAPITGGQSYNAGPLQKQYGMQVSPYHSAILSLLK